MAWVLPRLARENADVRVVSARLIGDPIAAVTRALLAPGAVWERPPTGDVTLRDLLERATKKISQKKILLVLDQFEGFLILADEERRDTFASLLHSLAERPIRNL
ncbi:hypothetical protein BURK_009026 [Burkholderia sp. SJ98]|nr:MULTISPECIES: hypothetical protein [Caballeronia]EKS71962.1 hypothetical protein BURK_009026 [Burkholderia sp. SJ98]